MELKLEADFNEIGVILCCICRNVPVSSMSLLCCICRNVPVSSMSLCSINVLATTGINKLMLTFLATKWLKDKTMRSTLVCVQRQNAYLHSLVSLSTLYH